MVVPEMEKIEPVKYISNGGFTLAEMLVSLVIGCMVLTAVGGIMWRVQKTQATVLRNLGDTSKAEELLDLIAVDLEQIASDDEAIFTVANGYSNGWTVAKIGYVRNLKKADNQPMLAQELNWVGSIDLDGYGRGIVIYRQRGGLIAGDSLLDSERNVEEQDMSYIPVCDALSYFRIDVINGENFQDSWNGKTLPAGLVVTLSFAEPFIDTEGNYDIYEEDKLRRVIALDRHRKLRFKMPVLGAGGFPVITDAEKEAEETVEETDEDPNDPNSVR